MRARIVILDLESPLRSHLSLLPQKKLLCSKGILFFSVVIEGNFVFLYQPREHEIKM